MAAEAKEADSCGGGRGSGSAVMAGTPWGDGCAAQSSKL